MFNTNQIKHLNEMLNKAVAEYELQASIARINLERVEQLTAVGEKILAGETPTADDDEALLALAGDLNQKITITANKTALTKVLKAGTEIEGVQLVQNQHLRIG